MTALHSLQGALGRTSGRSYKAAPRQLLQVDPNNAGTSPTLSHTHAHISREDAPRADGGGAAKEAAKLGREALGDAAPVSIAKVFGVYPSHTQFSQIAGVVRKEPLSHRQVLVILENLYDLVLEVEQLRRDQPPHSEEEAYQTWSVSFSSPII
jgi:DNA topoisomerase 2-associated protein PAT1